MATTLRTELTKAGFVIGGPGTAIVVQDYDNSKRHAQPVGSHTITATDPLLDRRFSNGYEWGGNAARLIAYDATNAYVLFDHGYHGAGFKPIPLTPGGVGTRVPAAEDRFSPIRRPSQGGVGTPAGDG